MPPRNEVRGYVRVCGCRGARHAPTTHVSRWNAEWQWSRAIPSHCVTDDGRAASGRAPIVSTVGARWRDCVDVLADVREARAGEGAVETPIKRRAALASRSDVVRCGLAAGCSATSVAATFSPLTQSVAMEAVEKDGMVQAAEQAVRKMQLSTDGEGEGDAAKRHHVNIVFIGHVDAGKSTLCGHLLYLTGNVDDRTMEKYEREAKSKGRDTWKYAWAMDLTEQERSKGKTTEYGVATFHTRHKHVTIIDAPGHKSYVPSMISGAGQADVGILVISARKGEFEAGFERGGQTREHAMLAKTAGVRQLIVAVNKMDEPTVQWSEERYREICGKLAPFLKQVGFRANDIVWVPVSGYTGANLRERIDAAQCPWYRGESLLELLDGLQLPPRPVDAPLRMTVVDKYKEMGVCMLGRIESGTLRNGDRLLLMPPRTPITVTGVWNDAEEVSAAGPGDSVKLTVKGVEEDDIHAGFVLCAESAPVEPTTEFDAQVCSAHSGRVGGGRVRAAVGGDGQAHRADRQTVSEVCATGLDVYRAAIGVAAGVRDAVQGVCTAGTVHVAGRGHHHRRGRGVESAAQRLQSVQ
eukprot:ctg_2071.g425